MNKKDFTTRISKVKVKMYNTALLYLGSESDAMDAVDEAVYKAYKSLKSLKHEEFFETWIIRILINECKKEIRRKKRIFVTDSIEDDFESFNYDVLPLNEAIHKLSDDLKSIIILRYFDDLTLAEVSQVLDIPQGTVVSKQRKALSLLKLNLMEEYKNG